MDIAVLEWISSHRPAGLDSVFLTISQLGTEYIPIILLAVVFWCLDRKSSDRVLITILMTLLVNQLLKLVFVVKRPWLKSDKVIPVEKALPDATGYSFPSGHTSNATACAGSISSLKVPIWLKILAWILAFLVAVSRLYLCVHTPSDVLWGFLSTLLVILFAKQLCVILDKKPSADLTFVCGSLLLVVLIAALAFIRPDNNTNARTDVLKMSGACLGGLAGWLICRRFTAYAPAQNLKSAVLRVVPGLIILIIMLEGSKPLLNSLMGETAGGCTRYFITTLTAFGIWPWIFTKVKL